MSDATQQHFDKGGSDASANAMVNRGAQSNMFAEFLAASPEQLKPQSAISSTLQGGSEALAGGKTVFNATQLPEMPPPAAEPADKKANFAAMMAQKQPDNDIADQALQNTLKNVA